MPARSASRVLVLGCGYAGRVIALAARAQGREVLGTVRSSARLAALEAEGLDVVVREELDASFAEEVDASTHVVIAFPPDGATEHRIAPALSRAGAITLLSTTGLYAELAGDLDDSTPIAEPIDERMRLRANAESLFREIGATILRCPGIYGPDRGLHVRVVLGKHRIPGDGKRSLSRIHVDDLAALVLATDRVRGETFVVGDETPAPHLEVVEWICATYGVPLPPFTPLEEVHPSLRGDRRVDGSRALRVLGVELRYPSYRLGMAPDVTGLRASATRTGD